MKSLFAIFLLFTSFYVTGQEKPNILWIITDDQRADAIACVNKALTGKESNVYGYVESPKIDALAKEGVLFVNAYCNSPACAPSRASMITGQYPHHNGIYGFENTHVMSFSKPVIPTILQGQGYQTALFGKYGVSIKKQTDDGKTVDPDFYPIRVDMMPDIVNKGLANFSGKQGQEVYYYPDGTNKALTTNPSNEKQIKQKNELEKELNILRAYTRGSLNDIVYGGVSSQPSKKTLDGVIVTEMENWLASAGNNSYQSLSGKKMESVKPQGQVMVNLGLFAPHTPVLPPAEFRDRFKDKKYALPQFEKSEIAKLPKQMQRFYDSVKIDDMTYSEKQQIMQDYYAYCAYSDAMVGQAVASFKAFCENRKQPYIIIIAVGDNGWFLGEHGFSTKFAPYVEANHQAVIVLSSDKKKFPPGQIVKDFVEYVDFAPTIYKSAGIDITSSSFKYLDGFDLADVANGKAPKREYILSEINHLFGPRASIRGKQYAFSMRVRPTDSKITNPLLKEIRWALNAPAKDVDMALYDLTNDPEEKINLAYNAAYAELTKWFRNKLGNIVLGDNRLQPDWKTNDQFEISSFAKGSDDKLLTIPKNIIPEKHKGK